MSSYSVVLPVYNGAGVIRSAVQSVLDQSCPAKEIFIINDGSTDDTLKILQTLAQATPQIQLISNSSNSGVAYSRNRGFRAVTADYTALLDADDEWQPHKMEEQLAFMEKKDLDFSYTGYSFRNEKGTLGKSYSVPESITFDSMLGENVIGTSTVVLKAALPREYPMSSKYLHEDYVLWMELLKAGKRAGGLNSPLMEYFVSKDSRSGDKKKAAKSRWIIYREALGLSLWQASKAFVRYGINGVKKHGLLF